MSTITVSRADVTNEEISQALRTGLGSAYHVLPGMKPGWGFLPPQSDHPQGPPGAAAGARPWVAPGA